MADDTEGGAERGCVRCDSPSETAREILVDIFEASLAGYWDWDIAGNTEYLSPAFKRMFGYEPDEIENSPESWQRLILPEDLPTVLECFDRHVTSRGAAAYYSEVRYRHKNGSVVWVICAGRVIEWGADGKPLRMVGCHVDITRRKEMEEELFAAKAALAEAQSLARLGNWEYDPAVDMLVWSDEMYRIHDRTKQQGTPLLAQYFEIVHPDDRAPLKKAMARADTDVEVNESDYRLCRSDGTAVWVHAIIHAAKAPDGSVIRLYGTVQDITAAKRLEIADQERRQQLIHADKLASLGILVSGVAHEINNPNNLIMLNIDVLTEVWKQAMADFDCQSTRLAGVTFDGRSLSEIRTDVDALLAGVLHGSERIRTIVKSLKDFVRVDKGALDQLIDSNEVVRAALLITDSLIRKSTDALSVEYGCDLPRVKGNAQQLEQVVINLLTNACEALTERSQAMRVSVRASDDGASVLVTVRDEGCGIGLEDISQVHVPFFTTKRDDGGTGLGLSISHGIMQAHGGDLMFESERGRGTTVTMLIPVYAGHDCAPAD